MTTTEQKLTLAREALEKIAAKRPHTVLYHDYLAMQAEAAQALAAITTESAPAAGAASIESEEFSNLLAQCNKYPQLNDPANDLIAHINAWGSQQREAGRKEGIKGQEALNRMTIDATIARAKKAEAQLKELHDVAWAAKDKLAAQPAVDIERVRDLVREYAKVQMPMAREMVWNEIAGLLSQDKSAALAQRAVGELPPLPSLIQCMDDGVSVNKFGLIKFMQDYAREALAARAVGGVDVSGLTRYVWTEAYIGDTSELVEAPNGTYVKFDDVRALLASAPAAPVGDGDERAKALEEAARLIEPTNDPSDWTEYAMIKAECAAKIRTALTQQKGG